MYIEIQTNTVDYDHLSSEKMNAAKEYVRSRRGKRNVMVYFAVHHSLESDTKKILAPFRVWILLTGEMKNTRGSATKKHKIKFDF